MHSGLINEECRILMVDDSPLIVKRVMDLIEDIKGARFLGNAESVTTIQEILSAERPDVLILDINLGNSFPVNGIQLLVMIRKTNPELRIVMLTNQSDSAYRKLSLENGADYFFDKSNDFDKIPAALNSIMREKNLSKPVHINLNTETID
jgi:DNA-binding NarL/FixJ family response regulator